MIDTPGELLTNVPRNRKLKITGLEGGSRMRQFIRRMGLSIGSEIKLVNSAPFAGPILIEQNGNKTAIGRGMALKIKVEVLE